MGESPCLWNQRDPGSDRSGWVKVFDLYSYPSALDTAPLSTAKVAKENWEVNLLLICFPLQET